jgi:hypothetical protein
MAVLLVLVVGGLPPAGRTVNGVATARARAASVAAQHGSGARTGHRAQASVTDARPPRVGGRPAGGVLRPQVPAAAATPGGSPAGRSAPPGRRDWLETDGGEVHTSVGIYRDCHGSQPLTHAIAAIDICITDRTYFVGHNPGVFTPLLLLHIGSILVWFDHAGDAHRLRVVAVRVWRGSDFPPVVARGIVAQFQTCIDLGGAFRRILDAVPE